MVRLGILALTLLLNTSVVADSINDYRLQHGLNVLPVNQVLTDYAQTYAQQHTLVHSNLRDLEGKISFKILGEVIGVGAPQILVDAWDQSPTHKAVLLGDWDEMGVGVDGYWTVVVFIKKGEEPKPLPLLQSLELDDRHTDHSRVDLHELLRSTLSLNLDGWDESNGWQVCGNLSNKLLVYPEIC